MKLLLSELAKLPKTEKKAALADLARAAKEPRNGQARELDGQIRDLEIRYEMTSEEMRRRFADGLLSDTADISLWLVLLYARDGR